MSENLKAVFGASNKAHMRMIASAEEALQKVIVLGEMEPVIEARLIVQEVRGYSALDVLQRVEREASIHMDDAREAGMTRASWAKAYSDTAQAAYEELATIRSEVEMLVPEF